MCNHNNQEYPCDMCPSLFDEDKRKLDFEKIDSLTYDLMIAKADIDFNTNIEKREHAAKLEDKIKELLR